MPGPLSQLTISSALVTSIVTVLPAVPVPAQHSPSRTTPGETNISAGKLKSDGVSFFQYNYSRAQLIPLLANQEVADAGALYEP